MGEDKLSYKEIQGLSKSQFALPGKGEGPEGKQGGSYPIPDESHARNALARVSQHGSEAEKRKVKSAVEKKFPDIKVSESKEAEAGERDVGTDAYANYVKNLTPGQKAADEKKRQATRIDDEYVPTLEEYVTHLESLEGEALEAELETLSQNELLEVLGTGLVKKAGKALMKRFGAQGRLKAAKAKGAKMKAKTDLATTKTANIAQKAKMKQAQAAHKSAKGPSKIGGALRKVVGAAPKKPVVGAAPEKKPVKVKSVPGAGLVSAEFEPESLIARTMDELSKRTLGSYTSKAAVDVMSRSQKPEPQYGHSKNKEKMVKRTQGIMRAADKLSK